MAHLPVLVDEVIAGLRCHPAGLYVDGTVGEGGHALAILEASAPDGRVIGLDRDAEALKAATEGLSRVAHRVRLVHANFASLPAVLKEAGVPAVDGIVLDLGVSTRQLDAPGRGFSFQRDDPLDMRMDVRDRTTAADLVNHTRPDRLTAILRDCGEERWAARIVRAIVAERRRRPIHTTGHLARLVGQAVPASSTSSRLHPATRTFLALRIAVNRELDWLAQGLEEGVGTLQAGGRICVIAFHSLEDRIVKHTFRRWAAEHPARVQVLTKRPIRPNPAEIAGNSRARSARLRVAERLA